MGTDLVEEVLGLLARLERLNLDNHSRLGKLNPLDDGRSSELQRISERLADVLLRLQRVSMQLVEDVSRIVFTTIEEVPGNDFRASLLEPLRLRRTTYAKFASYEASDADVSGWAEATTVQAGVWSLLLAGTASPSPTLVVTLQVQDSQILSEIPMLTLVRPNKAFETANVDSVGVNTVNLPAGRSILLVQGEKEIWQVPFALREA